MGVFEACTGRKGLFHGFHSPYYYYDNYRIIHYYYHPVDGGERIETTMFRAGADYGSGERDKGAGRAAGHAGFGMRKARYRRG